LFVYICIVTIVLSREAMAAVWHWTTYTSDSGSH